MLNIFQIELKLFDSFLYDFFVKTAQLHANVYQTRYDIEGVRENIYFADGKLDEAIDEYKQVAFSPLEKTAETELLVLIGNARLLLLNLVQDNAEYSALL